MNCDTKLFQAFVSEYHVTEGGGLGNLLEALAEAGFLIGIEKNRSVSLLKFHEIYFLKLFMLQV